MSVPTQTHCSVNTDSEEAFADSICYGTANGGRELILLKNVSTRRQVFGQQLCKFEIVFWNINYGLRTDVSKFQIQVPPLSRNFGALFDKENDRFLLLFFLKHLNNKHAFLRLITVELSRSREGNLGAKGVGLAKQDIDCDGVEQRAFGSSSWMLWPVFLRNNGNLTVFLNDPATYRILLEINQSDIGRNKVLIRPTLTQGPALPSHSASDTFYRSDDKLFAINWPRSVTVYDFKTDEVHRIPISGPSPKIDTCLRRIEPVVYLNPAIMLTANEVQMCYVNEIDNRCEWWKIDLGSQTRSFVSSKPLNAQSASVFVLDEDGKVLVSSVGRAKECKTTVVSLIDRPKSLKTLCFELLIERCVDRLELSDLGMFRALPREFRLMQH